MRGANNLQAVSSVPTVSSVPIIGSNRNPTQAEVEAYVAHQQAMEIRKGIHTSYLSVLCALAGNSKLANWEPEKLAERAWAIMRAGMENLGAPLPALENILKSQKLATEAGDAPRTDAKA